MLPTNAPMPASTGHKGSAPAGIRLALAWYFNYFCRVNHSQICTRIPSAISQQ